MSGALARAEQRSALPSNDLRGPGIRDHARQTDRLIAVRIRCAIKTHLVDPGITKLAAVGKTSGMPPAEAVRLLTRGS